MRVYSRTSIAEFLGDLVVYRNLQPVDTRLPRLEEISEHLGLPKGFTPRKSEREYARVMVELLRWARALEEPAKEITRMIYLGDTRLNDGTAFSNIRRAGGWEGIAFIGSEDKDPAHVDLVERDGGRLYLANRWAALADFDRFCRQGGFPVGEATAVLVDLDKTALGARGRNDRVIDLARVEAVRRTVGDLLQGEFDPGGFQAAYDRLNQAEFHTFTADNQDYLAYVCLILGTGLYQLETLAEDIHTERWGSFMDFITEVDERRGELPTKLRSIHSEIHRLVELGDPTPFKEFRYQEYRTTIGRMGHLADETPVEGLIRGEIVITQEVREIALDWRARGALLFGLSDKPDEASIPSEDQAARGYRAIHRTETHAVGG